MKEALNGNRTADNARNAKIKMEMRSRGSWLFNGNVASDEIASNVGTVHTETDEKGGVPGN